MSPLGGIIVEGGESGSGTTGAAIVAKTFFGRATGCTPLKSTFLVLLRSVHKIMRAVCQVLWLFNCWTFEVSFVFVLIPSLDLWTLPKVPGVEVVVHDFFLTVILCALKCE